MGVFDKASLALVPDGIKDGKLYSIKPTDGSGDFTFTRCDGAAGCDLAATRVDENGLIEKGRENIVKESNNFDQVWGQSSLNATSGQAGYDGTTDAWSISKTAQFGRLQQTVTLAGLTTMSVYAKASTNDWIAMRHSADGSSIANFDLTNGVFGAIGSNVVATNSVSVGNGWYRISVTWNYTGSSEVRIHPNASDSIGGETATIFIQDVQVEQGLVATDCIETGATTAQAGILEDLPRIDYTGGTPSLLMEPSRTNLMRYSEYFGGWSVIGTPTQTPNAATSPEGLTNAYSLSNTSGSTARIRNTNLVATSGDKFVVSIFAKENAGSTFEIRHQTSSYISVVFDLSDESYTGGGSWVDDVDFIDYGSGWYRCLIYVTAGATATGTIEIELANNDSIYAYGFMAESGSYATSYIPTYSTTAVTRSRDYYSNTSLSNIGSTDRCTFYCEIDLPQGREGFQRFFRLDGPTSSFAWKGNHVEFPVISIIGTGNITSSGAFTLSAGVHKLIARWENGVGSIFVDGVKKSEQATSSTTEVFDEFRSEGTGYRHLQKSALVFPEALSDAECITLTT